MSDREIFKKAVLRQIADPDRVTMSLPNKKRFKPKTDLKRCIGFEYNLK